MANEHALLAAYLQPPARKGWASIRQRLWRLALRLIAYALILTGLAWGIWHLWYGWQTTDWEAAEHAQALTAQALLTAWWLLGYLRGARANAQTQAVVEIFRRALATGDALLMPLAAAQPEPPVTTDVPLGPARLGPIQTLVSLLLIGRAITVVGWIFLLFAIAADTDKDLPTNLDHQLFTARLLMIGFGVLAFVAGFIWFYRRARMTISADEIGARWRVGGRTHVIEWGRARAFFQVRFKPNVADREVVAYILDTPEGALAWVSSGAGLQARWSAWHERAEQLAALVAKRTRLPLRDGSALAQRLTGEETDLPQLAREVGRPDLAHEIPESRTWRWGCAGCLTLVMVCVVLFVGSYGLSFYQSRYFTGLPARLHTEAPRFADPLAAPTGVWPIQNPTASDPSSAQYVDGAYWLRGDPGRTQWALAPSIYGDAAVEVTARELAATGSSDIQGVGLALRASADASDAVYFLVTPDGHAHLWQYDAQSPDVSGRAWGQLADQSDPAIHPGVGAWNRLLVVMRGGLYLCYVNDTLVITYYDQTHDIMADPTPHSGQAGLFVNDGAVGGAFRDFTVYPVQPPSSWWYV